MKKFLIALFIFLLPTIGSANIFTNMFAVNPTVYWANITGTAASLFTPSNPGSVKITSMPTFIPTIVITVNVSPTAKVQTIDELGNTTGGQFNPYYTALTAPNPGRNLFYEQSGAVPYDYLAFVPMEFDPSLNERVHKIFTVDFVDSNPSGNVGSYKHSSVIQGADLVSDTYGVIGAFGFIDQATSNQSYALKTIKVDELGNTSGGQFNPDFNITMGHETMRDGSPGTYSPTSISAITQDSANGHMTGILSALMDPLSGGTIATSRNSLNVWNYMLDQDGTETRLFYYNPLAINPNSKGGLQVIKVDEDGNTTGGRHRPDHATITDDATGNTVKVYADNTLAVDNQESLKSYTLLTATAGTSGTVALLTPTAGEHLSLRAIMITTNAAGANNEIYIKETITAQSSTNYTNAVFKAFFPVNTSDVSPPIMESHDELPNNYPLCLTWSGLATGNKIFVKITYKIEK